MSMPSLKLPATLPENLNNEWETLARDLEETQPQLWQTGLQYPELEFARAMMSSEFIRDAAHRNPEFITTLMDSHNLSTMYAPNEYRNRLKAELEVLTDDNTFYPTLRKFRYLEMLRIAWRDLIGMADFFETTRDLSHLANAMIDLSLEYLFQKLSRQYGMPVNNLGEAQRLLVIAVGKLGGQELNFSSDVDLIFVYPDAVTLSNPDLEPNQFYIKLAQQLIQALNQTTEDGFVFRVDMRLRPHGSSGPLVMNLSSFKHYYMEQGRDWERFALIRARIICGDKGPKKDLLNVIKSFVYRRYVDYGAIEALREMKQLIEREIQTQNIADDIKRGPGGIRQIEFIVQAFQLIRGGQDSFLQRRQILTVLGYLKQMKMLGRDIVDELMESYIFLRNLEHRLQMYQDRQTHMLPQDENSQSKISYAMGYDAIETLLKAIDTHRTRVSYHFSETLKRSTENQDRYCPIDVAAVLKPIWTERLDERAAVTILLQHGFGEDSKNIYQAMIAFKNSYKVRTLTPLANQRLEALLPQFLLLLGQKKAKLEIINRAIKFLEAVIKRSAYLALLLENPEALALLVNLLVTSPWIAQHISQYPLLLDELTTAHSVPERKLLYTHLDDRLHQTLLGIPQQDLEQQMDAVRAFKHRQLFRAGMEEVVHQLSVVDVGRYLTELAEVIIHEMMTIARHPLIEQATELKAREILDDFSVIAYGKLGSGELSYTSDLDLVFLHNQPREAEHLIIRLAQRLIRMLGTRTAAGILYEVDTRLRPSGAAGLLVSTLDAFENYQAQSAWTWEHQALVRARMIAGPEHIRERFGLLRQSVLCMRRDHDELRHQIISMRQKMLESKGVPREEYFDLKHARGGITDIEFIVQYGVLAWAHEHPVLCGHTGTLHLLAELGTLGYLNKAEAKTLADIFIAYRKRLNYQLLQQETELEIASEWTAERAEIASIWKKLIEK